MRGKVVKRIFFSVTVVWVTFVSLSFAQEAEKEIVLGEILKKSGIEQRIRSFPDLLEAALNFSKTSFTPQQQALLRTSMQTAFNADTLMGMTVEYWMTRSDESTLLDILEWFDSPLGSKIARLEVASSSPESLNARLRFERTISKRWIGQRRRLLIERLDDNMGRSDLMASLVTSLVRGIWKSFAPAGTQDNDQMMEEALAQIQRDIYPRIAQSTYALLVFSYRGIRNDDLQRYNEFYDSPSGYTYIRNLNGSLIDAFDVAADRFARFLATGVKSKAE